MLVYIFESDWNDFVNGVNIQAYPVNNVRNANGMKKIIVSPIEVIENTSNFSVIIRKMY